MTVEIFQGATIAVVVRWDPANGWHAANSDDITADIRPSSLRWEAGENITSSNIGTLTPSRLFFEVWNANGDYSPDNAQSPYNAGAKGIAEGRLIEVVATHGSTTERAWTGVVAKITPRVRRQAGSYLSVVEFECMGAQWRWLDGTYGWDGVLTAGAGALVRRVATYLGVDKSTSGTPTGNWRDTLRGESAWPQRMALGTEDERSDERVSRLLGELATASVGGIDDQTGTRGELRLAGHAVYADQSATPVLTLAEQEPAPADLEGSGWIRIRNIKDTTDERVWYSDFEASAVIRAGTMTSMAWGADKRSGSSEYALLAEWGIFPSYFRKATHFTHSWQDQELDARDRGPGVSFPSRSRITVTLTPQSPQQGSEITSVTWLREVQVVYVDWREEDDGDHSLDVSIEPLDFHDDSDESGASVNWGTTSVTIALRPYYERRRRNNDTVHDAIVWMGVFGQRHIETKQDLPPLAKRVDLPDNVLITGRKTFPVTPRFQLESAATTYLNRVSRRYGRLNRLVTIDVTPRDGADFLSLVGLRDGTVVKVVSGSLYQVQVNQRMIVKTRRVSFDAEKLAHFSFDLLSTDAYYDAPDTGAPAAPTLTTTANRLKGEIKVDIAGQDRAASHEIEWREEDQQGWPAGQRATATSQTATYNLTGLGTGTWDVRVRSLDSDGDPGPWAYSNDHVIVITNPPAPPRVTLTATVNSIAVEVQGDSGSGFVIAYRRQGDASYATAFTSTSNSGTRTITGLAAGTYDVRVHSANEGGRSAYVVRTLPTLPAPPSLALAAGTTGLTARVRGPVVATGAVVRYRAQGTTQWSEQAAAGRNPNVALVLAAGTWQVSAASTNASGQGAWSRTAARATRPTPPTVQATVSGDSVSVAIAGSTTAVRHQYASTQTNTFPSDRSVTGRTATVTLTGRAPGTHSLRVRSLNRNGDASAYSTISFYVVPPEPGAPGLTITPNEGGFRVAVAGHRHATAHELQYRLATATDWSAAVALSGRNAVHGLTGLTEGVYDIRVRSSGEGGTGPYTTVDDQTTLPDRPDAVTPTTGIDSIGLTLTKSATATGWEVQWALNGGAYGNTNRRTGTFTGSTASVSITGLDIKRYKVRYRVSNGSGNSDWREVTDILVGSTVAPTTPTFSLVPGLGKITVAFASSANAEKVHMQWRVQGDMDVPGAEATATATGHMGSHVLTVAEGAWEVRAYAENDVGRSGFSAWKSTVTLPSAPVVTLTGLPQRIDVAIVGGAAAVSHTVRWRSTSAEAFPSGNTADVSGRNGAHSITGLADGFWVVEVRSSNRLGGLSAAVTQTQRTNIPTVVLMAKSATSFEVMITGVPGTTAHQVHWRAAGQSSWPSATRTTLSGVDARHTVTVANGAWDVRVRASAGVNSKWRVYRVITLPNPPSATAVFGMGTITVTIQPDPVAATAVIGWQVENIQTPVAEQTATVMLDDTDPTVHEVKRLAAGSWVATVVAVNADGGRGAATTITGTVTDPPATPDPPALAMTAGANAVTVAVTGDSGATVHELQSRMSADADWSAATTLSGRSPTHTVSGTEGRYYVRVRSALQAGGEFSEWVAANRHSLPGTPTTFIAAGSLGHLRIRLTGTPNAVSHHFSLRLSTSQTWGADMTADGRNVDLEVPVPSTGRWHLRASSLNADGDEGPERATPGNINITTFPVIYNFTASATPERHLSIRLTGNSQLQSLLARSFNTRHRLAGTEDWTSPATHPRVRYGLNAWPIVDNYMDNTDISVTGAGSWDIQVRTGDPVGHWHTPTGSPVTVTAVMQPQSDAIAGQASARVQWGSAQDAEPDENHRVRWHGSDGSMMGEQVVAGEDGFTIPDLASGTYTVAVQVPDADGGWSAADEHTVVVPPAAPAPPAVNIVPAAVDRVDVVVAVHDPNVDAIQILRRWGTPAPGEDLLVPDPAVPVDGAGDHIVPYSGTGRFQAIAFARWADGTWSGGATGSVEANTLPVTAADSVGVNADRAEWSAAFTPPADAAQLEYRPAGDAEWVLVDMDAADPGFSLTETGLTPGSWQYRVRGGASDSAATSLHWGPWSDAEDMTVEALDASIGSAVPGRPAPDRGRFGTAAGVYVATASLTWDPPLAFAHRVAGYAVELTPSGAAAEVLTATNSRIHLSGMTPATAHSVRVAADFDDGSRSGWSDPLSFTTMSGSPRAPVPHARVFPAPDTTHELLAVVWSDRQGDVATPVWRMETDHYAPTSESTGGSLLPVTDGWDMDRETVLADALAAHRLDLHTVRIPLPDVTTTVVATARQVGGAEVASTHQNVSVAAAHAGTAGIDILLPHTGDHDTVLIQDGGGNVYLPFMFAGSRLPARIAARLRSAATGEWLTDTVVVFESDQATPWPTPLAGQDVVNAVPVEDGLLVAFVLDADQDHVVGEDDVSWTVGTAGEYQTREI